MCAGGVFVLDITGGAVKNELFENISGYCETLVFVTTIMIPLYTTGLLEKRKRRDRNSKLSKPVLMIISAVIAFVGAAVIKLGLSLIFRGL